MKVKLSNVRLAFADLWEPRPGMNGGAARYGAKLIFEPDSKAHKAMEAALQEVAEEKWGKAAAKVVKSLGTDKKCLRDGDNSTNKDGDIYDGFEGNLFVAAYNKKKPTTINRQRDHVEDDGTIYAGCRVNAIVDVYAMERTGQGKSINASLGGVQFFKDDDAFGGGGRVAADDFDEIDDDDFEF